MRHFSGEHQLGRQEGVRFPARFLPLPAETPEMLQQISGPLTDEETAQGLEHTSGLLKDACSEPKPDASVIRWLTGILVETLDESTSGSPGQYPGTYVKPSLYTQER